MTLPSRREARSMRMRKFFEQKNILFLIDGLSGGGAERVVLTLAQAMVEQGHEVTLLSLRKDCAYKIPEGVSYLLLEDLYHGRPLWRQTEIRRRARALDKRLKAYFAEKKIDLAISHLPKTDRIVAASSLLKEAWLCLHCALSAGELDHQHQFRRWRKKHQLFKTYNGRKLITVSHALQNDVRAIGIRPSMMRTIYNPIDLDHIESTVSELCPHASERFLLHVGRFNHQKRHDRLFEAFQRSGYPGKLILLGSGKEEEKRKLQALAETMGLLHRIIFLGFLPHPYSYMRAAEALILSSDYEGLPNVLLEALACGTQVISTNCPFGPAEILQGPLAKGLSDLDSASLAQAINRVLEEPIPIDATMLEPFSISVSVQRYLELINLKNE